MSFFEELKRRKVFKVGVGYLVVAWLVVQVASIGFPTFEAPPWALRVFILVVLLGFPISLLFAWAFDVTPEGVKAESASTGNKRFLAVAVALVEKLGATAMALTVVEELTTNGPVYGVELVDAKPFRA